MNPLDLVRADLQDFAGYGSARRAGVSGEVWLNANESPWPSPAAADSRVHRYPDPQPPALRVALAGLFAVRPEQVLVGRGSDEAIDLLVRALCRPGIDGVLVAPPVFGMYAVSARLQGAPLIEVPLLDGPEGFRLDVDAVIARAVERAAKIVFVGSPANPTGQSLPPAELRRLAAALAGRALLVVDEAYLDYSDQPSASALIEAWPHVAVLRTLSKAHALAGARIGCLIADARLIALLRNVQAPYPLPDPCVALALRALSPDALAATRARVATVRAERTRVEAALRASPAVRRVYLSDGNYLLVRCVDAGASFERLLAAGVVVRDMRAQPQLGDALRISIGSPDENTRLLAAFGSGATA